MSLAVTPRFVIVGANHRSASLSLRDTLFVDDAGAADFLLGLKGAGLGEAMVLSTCDRVEVWTAYHDGERAAHLVTDALAARAHLGAGALAEQLYCRTGREAVRHAFAVASSLDSLVIGEPQILGQVKAAHRLARDAGVLGPELDSVMQAAFAVAKRVRSETSVGEGPVSIAAAAVQLAKEVHGELSRCRALLVGGGDMGELVAEHLLAAGLAGLSVATPRPSRAEALARSLSGHVVAFDQIREALVQADVVISAVGGRNLVLASDVISQALRSRRQRPIFLVDAGIPGDIEPAVNRVDNAFLYDLNDLERAALEGRTGRQQAARAAWSVVEEELNAFLRGRSERAAVPAIVALRERCEALRDGALAEAGGDAAEATRLLVNRVLHAPSEVMKAAAAESPDWQAMEKTLRTLFRLE